MGRVCKVVRRRRRREAGGTRPALAGRVGKVVGRVGDSCGSLRATCTGRELGGGWAAADPAEQECGDAEDAGPDEVQMQVRARRDLRSRKEVY